MELSKERIMRIALKNALGETEERGKINQQLTNSEQAGESRAVALA